MNQPFKDVFKISFPLVFASFSSSIMVFFNRVFLFNYSLETFNAVASVLPIYYLFAFSGTAIIGISEVFIAEFNGEKQFSKASQVAWQMIWVSLATVPLFYLTKNKLGDWLIPASMYAHGKEYFNGVIFCVPLHYLVVAFSSFFVGIKETKAIVITAVVANLINILLDWLLIYGYGFIPRLGALGAALATLCALLCQVIFLLAFFLRGKNRRLYETHKPQFSKSILKECWKVGYPSALGQMIEIGAIYVAFTVLSKLQPAYTTVFAIGQTFIGLFAFITEGMKRGIIAISSNLIGEARLIQNGKNWAEIQRALKAHILVFTFLIILSEIALLLFFKPILHLMDVDTLIKDALVYKEVLNSMHWVYGFLLLEGVSWIISGILVSLKDTKFIMVVSCLSMWLAFMLPLFIIAKIELPPHWIWISACLYSVTILIAFTIRHFSFGKRTKLVEGVEHGG